MKNKKVRVVDLVKTLFDKLSKEKFKDLELVDVEFIKEGKSRYLRVYIDKEGGVSIDDCTAVSRELNSQLDRHDPIEEEYILEVSSPGIERALKSEADFTRFAEELVQIKLYFPMNGTKVIEGILKGYKDGEVAIKHELTDAIIHIPFDKIASSKLLFRFN